MSPSRGRELARDLGVSHASAVVVGTIIGSGIFLVPAEMMQAGAAQDRLNHAIITLSAFAGLVMEGMTRGDGWRFLDIGRRLERALQMAELLRNSLTGEAPPDIGVLEAVLEIADSSITYRSRYLTSLQNGV